MDRLDQLERDIESLIGAVACDGSKGGAVAATIKRRIADIRRDATLSAPEASRDYVLVPRENSDAEPSAEAMAQARNEIHERGLGFTSKMMQASWTVDRAREIDSAALVNPAPPTSGECKHKWRNSERHDPMLPCAWVQQCAKCGAYEDEK